MIGMCLLFVLDFAYWVITSRISDTRSLADLLTSIIQRVGDDIDRNNLPQILVCLQFSVLYNHWAAF